MKYIKKIYNKVKSKIIETSRKLGQFLFVDLRVVFSNYMKHDGELSTCAIAFFLLISFIPASLVIISILSFYYKSGDMAELYLNLIKSQLPSIDIHEIIEIIDRIVYSKRYLAFIWIPFLFWWGSLVFDILERALEKAFMIEESRIYWKAKIRHFSIILGMGFVVLFFTVFTNFVAIIKNSDVLLLINENLSDIPLLKEVLIQIGNIPIILTSLTALLINTCMIFIIYRFVPPKKLDNKSIIKGALFASFSYEFIKIIFSYYITNINDYSSIFGSLSTIVILMIWIWYSCFLFVIGAEMAWVFFEKSENAAELNFKKE